ncbi:ankyrin repeat-containing domain protein, partial [Geopyxis carbonaria]
VAAKYGDWDVVQILLDDGANREAKDDEGRTALMLATMKGHLGLVSYLIRNNVDQASKDNQGLTARDHAIAMQKKIVENEKLNSNRSRICELLGAGNENNQVEKLDEENMDDSRRNSTMALRNSQSS